MNRWQALAAFGMLAFAVGVVVCFVYAWYGGMAGCIGGAYGALFLGVATEGEQP